MLVAGSVLLLCHQFFVSLPTNILHLTDHNNCTALIHRINRFHFCDYFVVFFFGFVCECCAGINGKIRNLITDLSFISGPGFTQCKYETVNMREREREKASNAMCVCVVYVVLASIFNFMNVGIPQARTKCHIIRNCERVSWT